MAQKSKGIPENKKPSLTVNIEQAVTMILERIESGIALMNATINSENELDRKKAEYRTWDDYNTEMLRSIFDNDTISNEYSSVTTSYGIRSLYDSPSLRELINNYAEGIQKKIDSLTSIKERLPLYAAAMPFTKATPSTTTSTLKVKTYNNDVFLVHGHNEAIREEVARLLEKLDLHPIILHEQANSGMTVIEKLEAHSDVGFAVILLTPDDEGKSKKPSSSLQDRARQNVIAELGYFVGKIGRNRICPLYVDVVELPSDFTGVVYTPYDSTGGWKLKLGRELKAAGYVFDASNLL